MRLCHVTADLSEEESLNRAAEAVKARIETESTGPILLVNNAGFGLYGAFGTSPTEAEEGMIDLNIRAVVALTGRLLPLLRERGGWIVNVASLAAFQPVPYFATYAASKAFVLHWSLALDEELRGFGVRALAVCPGPTESQFFRRAGFRAPPSKTKGQTAEAVVEESFRALHRGRAMVVTGWRHRWAARVQRLFSKPLMTRLAGTVMKRLRLSELQSSGRIHHD